MQSNPSIWVCFFLPKASFKMGTFSAHTSGHFYIILPGGGGAQCVVVQLPSNEGPTRCSLLLCRPGGFHHVGCQCGFLGYNFMAMDYNSDPYLSQINQEEIL